MRSGLMARAALLMAAVVILQAIVTALVPPEVPFKVRLLNQHLGNAADIIYFGDSSVRHLDPKDDDSRTMVDFLRAMVPEASIGDVLGSSYNLDLYAEYIKYIAASAQKPTLVIVPINLRSFSPEWDLQPMYQFEEEKLYLSLARVPFGLMFFRPLAVFRDMQPIDSAEYRESPVFDGTTLVGRVKNFDDVDYTTFSDKKLRRRMTYRYLFALDPGHRKLRSMGEIVAAAAQGGFGVLFYATPVDYETGERVLGPRFTQRIQQNMDVIRSVLRRAGTDVLDLSHSRPAGDFVRYRYPIEHLNQNGRRWVAAQIHHYLEERFTPFLAADRHDRRSRNP